MTEKPKPRAAGVYWPNGDLIDAEPSAHIHDGETGKWAVVQLSSHVTMHIHTVAQAQALIGALARAQWLLEDRLDGAHAARRSA